jgi:hypothetical protein
MTMVCFSIVIYLIFGMIFKKLVYGSVGINLIPNANFWRNLPNLFKEGVLLTFYCFNKRYVNGSDKQIVESDGDSDRSYEPQDNEVNEPDQGAETVIEAEKTSEQ